MKKMVGWQECRLDKQENIPDHPEKNRLFAPEELARVSIAAAKEAANRQ